MILDYRQLQALSAVLEEQSFEKAASKLHVTQSAVSQRIKQLEDRLGLALVIRSNPLAATAAGQQVLKHYHQLNILQADLMGRLSINQGALYTQLSIALNADSLETWFLDAVQPLMEQWRFLFDLKVDDQEQTQNLLRAGEVMGCISSSPRAIQGCHCIELGVMNYRLLASPAFMHRFFVDGVTREALKKAPIADYSNKDQLQSHYLEKFYGVEAGEYFTHRIPSSVSFLDFIVRGFACGMVPDQQSASMLAEGLVVDVAPGNYLSVPLYWHVWSLNAGFARELTDALVKAAEKQLDAFSAHEQHELMFPR